jgi:hypothetical protein
MDSQLAINTIKESCHRVGYPTHDAEQERRKLINQSCDYAIECIGKLEQIQQIVDEWNNDASHSFVDMCKINGILNPSE